MDKKTNLFDEVEKNMIFKSREIQRVKEELEAKEVKLTKVNDKLTETIRSKEEQEHLVSKHIETEVKLNIQAKKLQSGCDDMGQDLDKLHDKLDNVNDIESANDSVKDTFMTNIEETVDQLTSKIEKFGQENERRIDGMQEEVEIELSARQDQVNQLISELKNLLSSHNKISQNVLKEIEEDQKNFGATRDEVIDAVEKSTKKGKSVGESFVAQTLPHLEIIAKKVREQSECLQTFSENIQEALGKIKSNVGKSVTEIIEIVDDTEQRVKTHFCQEEKSVSELKVINTQVVASQTKLKKTVDLMMNAYKEHYDNVGQLNVDAKVVIKKLDEQNHPLKVNVEDNVFKLKTEVEELEKETNKQVEEAEKKTRTSVEESEKICEDIQKAKKNLKTSSGRFFKDCIEIVDISHEEQEKANSSRKKMIEENQAVNEENSNAAKKGYENGQKVLVSKLHEEINSSTVEELGELKALSKEQVDGLTGQLIALDEEVSTVVWEEMKVYQPTGETPVRTERHYPRYLAATEPHQRILDRFRKTTEVEEDVTMSLDGSVNSELSYNLENENKSGSFSSSSKRELKKPEVIQKNILKNSNQ